MEEENGKTIVAAAGAKPVGLVPMASDEESSAKNANNSTTVSTTRMGDNVSQWASAHGLHCGARDVKQPPPVLQTRTTVSKEGKQEAEDTVFVSTLTVHPRYRRHHSRSQGSFSLNNGSVRSPTHSRMSSREQFSWDSTAWKEVSSELAFTVDTREYLRLGRVSSECIAGANESRDQPPRRHVRSLAAWDRSEVEARGNDAEKSLELASESKGCVTPIGKDKSCTESVFETAPLGHQQSFSLFSQRDVSHQIREPVEGEREVKSERDGGEVEGRGSIMTHILVKFKQLYGVFYVPQSEWGTFGVGDLVSVESHSGENMGRVVGDLTSQMREELSRPSCFAQLPREVLYPEDASKPLEAVEPGTNKETLLRLPRVIRRGMNKGKKRVYYARRRDTEAYNVCQRLIRERGYSLTVSGVEYQVDFKRITVFCSDPCASVVPSELYSFIQQLASLLRGSAVEVLFSVECPASLEVTKDITHGLFNDVYACLARAQENEGARACPRTPSSSHHTPPAQRSYVEGKMTPVATPPFMPTFGLPPPVLPQQPAGMMPTVNIGALYSTAGMPSLGWGWPSPPPYLVHPRLTPGMNGRM
ncbi:uncharacterized protein Tco025E_00840 [Trypanosoma conorhini]|uniref:PSP1 C-terminal domain-containing protein n=1 Tax=Trypanosoma conorhini TaxID=83891 RepID=A0A3R7PKX4_9TRYP|nr:uncharacterized protein Tco025E_00840 [Trypanosoma conorhini]RNF26878.1 hypothetical protein Tco025E_00840 [Trypanosoma conorhini]